jgi:hypothetical protein
MSPLITCVPVALGCQVFPPILREFITQEIVVLYEGELAWNRRVPQIDSHIVPSACKTGLKLVTKQTKFEDNFPHFNKIETQVEPLFGSLL